MIMIWCLCLKRVALLKVFGNLSLFPDEILIIAHTNSSCCLYEVHQMAVAILRSVAPQETEYYPPLVVKKSLQQLTKLLQICWEQISNFRIYQVHHSITSCILSDDGLGTVSAHQSSTAA